MCEWGTYDNMPILVCNNINGSLNKDKMLEWWGCMWAWKLAYVNIENRRA